jgi:hypothetical protein
MASKSKKRKAVAGAMAVTGVVVAGAVLKRSRQRKHLVPKPELRNRQPKDPDQLPDALLLFVKTYAEL